MKLKTIGVYRDYVKVHAVNLCGSFSGHQVVKFNPAAMVCSHFYDRN